MNSGLLERARAAAVKLAETDRQALLARADFHAAVRRLHLAGGSLREIALALTLSHQRVHQIVKGAGGTWGRRICRRRAIRPDALCSWCGRPPAEVAQLIAGPNVFICDVCVRSAENAVDGKTAAGPFVNLTRRSIAVCCAFCGKHSRGDLALVAAPAGHICTDCLRVCRDILDSFGPSARRPPSGPPKPDIDPSLL